MNHDRNVEGLRDNAQRKRHSAFERTDKAIQQLLKESKTINFNTVAQASGVSKAWLYKEPDIKARIEHLRSSNQGAKKAPPQQRTSDASKDALIKNLKVRIKELEATNRELRRQNEVAYGHLAVAESVKRQVEQLQRENQRLKTQLENCHKSNELVEKTVAPLPTQSKVLLLHESPEITQIKSLLSSLGIKMNTTLSEAINNTPAEIVRQALETLSEAIVQKRVRNPEGFLLKAIQDVWNPNENYLQQVELTNFSQWYSLAKARKLVTAATQIDGVQHVLTVLGEWVPFNEMVIEYPLEKLQTEKHT